MDIYSALYPEWEAIVNEMTVLLLVGCPNPYDAMVREHNGKEYIIFDLIRFGNYEMQGCDIEQLIRQLITHETSHLCLHKKYPVPTADSYLEQLKYITFDEGFAHLLAYQDNVKDSDHSAIINEHYEDAYGKLQEAMKQTDPQRQKELLEQSNSGSYWSKFASISGKLFLLAHIDGLHEIYDNGVDRFISYMGL